MDNNPLVSIYIPVFNGESLIHRALDSAINQTYRNIEIVVVDNASTDSTREIVLDYLRRDKRIKYIRNGENIGFTRNLLKCFLLISGDYAQLLCHDDWLSRNYIEEGVKSFNQNPDTAAVFTRLVSVKEKAKEHFSLEAEVSFKSKNYSIGYFVNRMYRTQWASICLLSMLRKSDLTEVSSLILKLLSSYPFASTGLKLYEIGVAIDWLISLEIVKKYNYLTFINQSAYIKLDHPNNVGKQHGWDFSNAGGIFEYYDFLRKALDSVYAHNFKTYLFGMRVFMGQEVVNTIIFNLSKKKMSAGSLIGARKLKYFFKDYTFLQKIFVSLLIIPMFTLRLSRFAFRKIKSREELAYERYLFLDQNGKFTV